MARDDYDDVLDIENMSDGDLKTLVLQELTEFPEIDVDLIEVNVQEGAVQVAGRVGTEQEVQQVEQLLTDVLGINRVRNDLVVDELVRGQRSEAADDASVEDNEADAELGDESRNTSDTADHLLSDIPAEQYGTHNMQEAIERGTAYEPPDRPIQQGVRSRENH